MKTVSIKRINSDAVAANDLIRSRSNEITNELMRANDCGISDYTIHKVIALSICAFICFVALVISIITFNKSSYTSTGISIALISVALYGFVRFMGADFIELSKLADFRKYKEALMLRDKLNKQTTADITEAFKNSVDENGNFMSYDLGYEFGTATNDCLNELSRISKYENYKMRFDFIYWLCSIALTVGAVLVTTDIVYNIFRSGIAENANLVVILVFVSIITLIGYAIANFYAVKSETSFPTAMMAGDVGIAALSGVAIYLVVGIFFVLAQILVYAFGAIILFGILAGIFSSN